MFVYFDYDCNFMVLKNSEMHEENKVHISVKHFNLLEIVYTIAAPAFNILFIGCVLNTKIAYKTAARCYYKMAKLAGDETNASS